MNDSELVSRLRRKWDRRSFLKAFGVFAGGAVVGGTLQAVFNVVKTGRGLFKVDLTRVRMGTYVTLTAVDESRDRAQEAIGRAFDEMDRLIAIFSRHDPATPVAVLNDAGALTGTPPELIDVVHRSLDFHRMSGGTFDITVKPVLDLFASTVGMGRDMPAVDEIDHVLARVGSKHIEISGRHMRFARPGMGITLDGIAKGYIVDRTSETLTGLGIESHLINAGGDIRASGKRSDGRPWTIAVEDPAKKRNYPEVIRLTNGAVATSGSYEIYYDKARVFHHVIDPRSGASPGHNESVSVIARSVMEADALSTSVFVLEPTDGLRFIEGLQGAECLVLGHAGTKSQSNGWAHFAAARDGG